MTDVHLSDEILNEYLDGRIPPGQQEAIDNHLFACQNCARRYQSLRLLMNDLDALPELELSRDLTESVLRAIRPPVVMPKLWQWAAAIQLPLAGVLLLISLPLLLDLEVMQKLDVFGSPFFVGMQTSFTNFFEEVLVFFAQPFRLVYEMFSNVQQTNLPFSFLTLMPILLAAGVLWVVGNGLLLRNVSNGQRIKQQRL